MRHHSSGRSWVVAYEDPLRLPSESNAGSYLIATPSRALAEALARSLLGMRGSAPSLKKTADTTVVVATIGFTVADNLDYTVYATGGTGGAPVTNFVTTDANPVPTASQVEVRIVNMSPSAGAVDVFVTAPNADLSAATPTAAGLAYQSASPYAVFSPGTDTLTDPVQRYLRSAASTSDEAAATNRRDARHR